MRDYSKIYNVGHKAVAELFKHDLLVEEKIDGSQFSFGCKDGELWMRTHHQDVTKQEPFGQFADVMKFLREKHKEGKIKCGYTYRGEVVDKKKHNLLTYERLPKNKIIIFDIDKGEEDYLSYTDKVAEANALDLETVPYMFFGRIESPETIKTFLGRPSILGAPYIEGVVLKAYGQFYDGKKTVMAKFVADRFKEVRKESGVDNKDSRGNILSEIGLQFKTDARWLKGIQHLRDQGKLEGAPADIKQLRMEIMRDVEEECADTIKDQLFSKFKGDVLRMSVHGFPEFYKNYLMLSAFPDADVPASSGVTDPLSEVFPEGGNG